MRAGVIPTPGVAVLVRLGEADLGCVISASHNPYQDNGIKFLGGDGRKLGRRPGGVDRAARRLRTGGVRWERGRPRGRRRASTSTGWSQTYGARRLGRRWGGGRLRERRRVRASRPRSSRDWASTPASSAPSPDGRNINAGVGSTHLDARRRGGARRGRGLRDRLRRRRRPLPRRRRRRPAGERRRDHRGDRARAARVDRVVVTSMTNLGFHRVMREPRHRGRGDRRRRPLRARADARDRRDARRRAVRPRRRPDSPHDRRRPRDGAHAARRRSTALGMSMDEARRSGRAVPAEAGGRSRRPRGACRARSGSGRRSRRPRRSSGRTAAWCVRASGTEPVVRVMVEAEDAASCAAVCNHLVGIVEAEIGEG